MFFTFIVFVVILGLLVFVHELGHFFTAKKSGVSVEEFGFGLPPRIFGIYKDSQSKKWKKVGIKSHIAPTTIYSLNWIPLGGFVKIKGEQGENANDPDSFGNKPIGKRILIISAGVIMNIFLSAFLFFVGYTIGMPQEIDDSIGKFAKISNEQIIISGVFEKTPAQEAGVKPGDAIIDIDGQKFNNIENIQKHIKEKSGEEMNLHINRDGVETFIKVTPKILDTIESPVIGVDLTHIGVVAYPWYIAIWEGIKTTGFFLKEIVVAFFDLIKNLIVAQRVSVDLSGPVGIAVMTGEVTRLGFIYILQFAALLSLNLAVINFMPFPALDGGRALFLVIEKLRGKPVNPKVESLIHSIGLYALLILVVIVTYKDVIRFSDKFKNIWSSFLNIF